MNRGEASDNVRGEVRAALPFTLVPSKPLLGTSIGFCQSVGVDFNANLS